LLKQTFLHKTYKKSLSADKQASKIARLAALIVQFIFHSLE